MINARKKSSIRSECGLLALPEELLLKVLAHLRLPALASVRLVCRLLRKLSYSLISTLNTIQEDLDGLDHTAESIVAEQLQALPSLTKLRYRGDPRNCAALLTIPGCASKLRELILDLGTRTDTSIEVVRHFCAKLKSATAVTSLKWDIAIHVCRSRERQPEIDTLLRLALANVPQLVSLECEDLFRRVPDAVVGNIVQLTALQRLKLSCSVWEQLLPHLASFPCLKDIGCVPFKEQDAVERVAALTTLTRLQAGSYRDFASSPALSRLSALQALSLLCALRPTVTSIEFLIRGLTQLTELGLTQLTELVQRDHQLELTRLSWIVAPLRCLERLHVHSGPCPTSVILEAPLLRLRHLSVSLRGRAPSEYPALCSALAGLETLSVTSSSAPALVPHLSQLTRLIALQIEAADPQDARVPASFLTSLPGLVDLRLRHVLSPNNARSDIPCLATLTRLQWLVVESVFDAGVRLQRSFDVLYQPLDAGSCFWRFFRQPQRVRVNRVPVKDVFLISSEDLKPLRALRMLEGWDLCGAWHGNWGDPENVNSEVGKLCGICNHSAELYVLGPRR